MKKLLYAIVFCGLMCSNAFSAYMGTFNGNDKLTEIEGCTVALAAKIDTGNFIIVDEVQYAYLDQGYWNTFYACDTSNACEPYKDIDFVSIKASNAYVLYSTENAWRGEFDMKYLDYKDISHVSFWKSTCTVPIPGTFILLGSALSGLLAVRRKRNERGER